MTILKSTIYAWMRGQKEPVTFRQIMDHFPKIMGSDIHNALVEMIEQNEVETIPARYRAK